MATSSISFTEQYFDEFDDLKFPKSEVTTSDLYDLHNGLYGPVPWSHDVALNTVMFSIGFILNCIILFCYFGVRSDIALYFRVFAVYDIVQLIIRA